MNEVEGWTPRCKVSEFSLANFKRTYLSIYLLDPERVCHETLLSSRNAEVDGRPNSGQCWIQRSVYSRTSLGFIDRVSAFRVDNARLRGSFCWQVTEKITWIMWVYDSRVSFVSRKCITEVSLKIFIKKLGQYDRELMYSITIFH